MFSSDNNSSKETESLGKLSGTNNPPSSDRPFITAKEDLKKIVDILFIKMKYEMVSRSHLSKAFYGINIQKRESEFVQTVKKHCLFTKRLTKHKKSIIIRCNFNPSDGNIERKKT